MIYCAGCGLYMSNGFCLHGDVDAIERARQRAALERDLVKRLPAPPKRR